MPQIALSRRNALGVLSASAAVAVAAPAVALGEGTRPVLALKNVPLSWPMYHRLKDFDLPPRIGDSLTLRREGRHPSDAEGVAVYDASGDRLGYVAQRDAAAVSWALERGSEVEARISHLETPVVKGQLVGGWGNVRIDLDVRESATA